MFFNQITFLVKVQFTDVHVMWIKKIDNARKTYRVCNSDKYWMSPDSVPVKLMLDNDLGLNVIHITYNNTKSQHQKPLFYIWIISSVILME